MRLLNIAWHRLIDSVGLYGVMDSLCCHVRVDMRYWLGLVWVHVGNRLSVNMRHWLSIDMGDRLGVFVMDDCLCDVRLLIDVTDWLAIVSMADKRVRRDAMITVDLNPFFTAFWKNLLHIMMDNSSGMIC